MLRGRLERKLHPSELVERDTKRKVFIRGVNVPAKLHPFQYGLKDADLKMLVANGFTAIRLIVTWESLEPAEGKYNKDHMEYILKTIRECRAHGISVIVDPHQDVWSQCSGGDGAPEWTLKRLGFNLEYMKACCGSYKSKPEEYPMLWATNYHLFACATMFTLFFGSERFASNVRVGSESAQEWLQTHFIKAFSTLAECLKNEDNVIGFGTMNEPSLGWIGCKNIQSTGNEWSFGYKLTPQQCIDLAAGETIQNVKFYEYPLSWPRTETLNEYKAVLCNNIWPRDAKPNHFALGPDEDAVRLFIIPFWEKFTKAIHAAGGGDLLIFTELPPLEHPGQPIQKYNRPDHEIHAPHFYDAITMGLGSFKWWLSIDFLTGLPGLFCCAPWARHSTVKLITHDSGGVILGETGVPWMGEHKTNAALEATFNAIESNMVPATFLWCFAPNHKLDDGWNRENFSIHSNGEFRIHRAIRPYAMRVAGVPLRMSFEGNVFQLTFKTDMIINNQDTEIFLTDRIHKKIVAEEGVYTVTENILRYTHAPSSGCLHRIRVEFV